MNIPSFTSRAIAVLSRGVDWILYSWRAGRRGARSAMPRQREITLRDSAAFALSCYWARYHDGWSLVLFRDASGAVRHVACETSECTFVDVLGRCTEEQISKRVGMPVTASHGEEIDVQPLLGTIPAVLEAADELRQHVEDKGSQREAATPAA
jgi:hypothetical protein